MVIRLFWTSTTSSRQVREQQTFLRYVLKGQQIQYELIDLSDPGNIEQRKFCLDKGVKDNDGYLQLPQLFNDQQPCGVFNDFESALDSEHLLVFLGLMTEEEWQAKRRSKIKKEDESEPTDGFTGEDDEEIEKQSLAVGEFIAEIVDLVSMLIEQVKVEEIQKEKPVPKRKWTKEQSKEEDQIEPIDDLSEKSRSDIVDSPSKKEKRKKTRKWDDEGVPDKKYGGKGKDGDESVSEQTPKTQEDLKIDEDETSEADEVTVSTKKQKTGEGIKPDLKDENVSPHMAGEQTPDSETISADPLADLKKDDDLTRTAKSKSLAGSKANIGKTAEKRKRRVWEEPAVEVESSLATEDKSRQRMTKLDMEDTATTTTKKDKADRSIIQTEEDKDGISGKQKVRRRWADEIAKPVDLEKNNKKNLDCGVGLPPINRESVDKPGLDAKIVPASLKKNQKEDVQKEEMKAEVGKRVADKEMTSTTNQVQNRPRRKWSDDHKEKSKLNVPNAVYDANKEALATSRAEPLRSEKEEGHTKINKPNNGDDDNSWAEKNRNDKSQLPQKHEYVPPKAEKQQPPKKSSLAVEHKIGQPKTKTPSTVIEPDKKEESAKKARKWTTEAADRGTGKLDKEIKTVGMKDGVKKGKSLNRTAKAEQLPTNKQIPEAENLISIEQASEGSTQAKEESLKKTRKWTTDAESSAIGKTDKSVRKLAAKDEIKEGDNLTTTAKTEQLATNKQGSKTEGQNVPGSGGEESTKAKDENVKKRRKWTTDAEGSAIGKTDKSVRKLAAKDEIKEGDNLTTTAESKQLLVNKKVTRTEDQPARLSGSEGGIKGENESVKKSRKWTTDPKDTGTGKTDKAIRKLNTKDEIKKGDSSSTSAKMQELPANQKVTKTEALPTPASKSNGSTKGIEEKVKKAKKWATDAKDAETEKPDKEVRELGTKDAIRKGDSLSIAAKTEPLSVINPVTQKSGHTGAPLNGDKNRKSKLSDRLSKFELKDDIGKSKGLTKLHNTAKDEMLMRPGRKNWNEGANKRISALSDQPSSSVRDSNDRVSLTGTGEKLLSEAGSKRIAGKLSIEKAIGNARHESLLKQGNGSIAKSPDVEIPTEAKTKSDIQLNGAVKKAGDINDKHDATRSVRNRNFDAASSAAPAKQKAPVNSDHASHTAETARTGVSSVTTGDTNGKTESKIDKKNVTPSANVPSKRTRRW